MAHGRRDRTGRCTFVAVLQLFCRSLVLRRDTRLGDGSPMPTQRIQTGEITGADEPDWEPLVALMAPELVGWFMWMFPVTLADGTRVEAYKHQSTRRYLYLDADLRAWGYREDGRYSLQRSVSSVLELVLAPWWESGHAEPDEVLLCWEAIERARRLDVGRRRG
jgi:hypothetical protein